MSAHGWYGPPNSRRWHYFGDDGRSLCGKWLVVAWDAALIDKAYGPANGDCAACERKLASGGYVTEDVFEAIGEIARSSDSGDA